MLWSRCKVFMPLPSPLVSGNLELKTPKKQNQILSSITVYAHTADSTFSTYQIPTVEHEHMACMD